MIWRRQAEPLRLVVGRERVRAELAPAHGKSATWSAERAYETLDQLTESVAQLAQEIAPRCRDAAIELERPPAQIRTLADLPPVKLAALKALIAQGAGRFFRRNGMPLSTDAAWLRCDGHVVCRAVAAPEPLLEAVAAGVRATPLSLRTIRPVLDTTGLVLLPASERAARRARSRQAQRRLAVAAALVWLLTGATFLGGLAGARRSVRRDLAALQQPLAAALEVRSSVRDARETLGAMALSRTQRASGLAALAAITATLPDSAVISSLVWSIDSGVRVVGAARHPEMLPAALARAGIAARLDTSPTASGPMLPNWLAFRLRYGTTSQSVPGNSR